MTRICCLTMLLNIAIMGCQSVGYDEIQGVSQVWQLQVHLTHHCCHEVSAAICNLLCHAGWCRNCQTFWKLFRSKLCTASLVPLSQHQSIQRCRYIHKSPSTSLLVMDFSADVNSLLCDLLQSPDLMNIWNIRLVRRTKLEQHALEEFHAVPINLYIRIMPRPDLVSKKANCSSDSITCLLGIHPYWTA